MLPLQERIVDRTLIHRGDLASSYSARDVRLDRRVFLKLLNPSLTVDTEIRARFEREAKAAARIEHPNLARIHEFGEDHQEGLYMILEWVEGSTLRERIANSAPLSVFDLTGIARQMLSALHALHHAGVLHRDLKPENILIGSDGRLRITDFSLAALHGGARLTHHHAIVGTPAYMSPEQATGRAPDARSDLFSCGIILFEAATGNNPFTAEELLEALRRVRELEVPVEESLPSDMPPSIRALIRSLLEKSPASRPADARAAMAMIEDLPGESVNYSSARREFRPWIYAGAALTVLVLLGLMFLKDRPDRTQADQSMPPDSTTHPAIISAIPQDTLFFKATPPTTEIAQKPSVKQTETKETEFPSVPDSMIQAAAIISSSVDSATVYLSTEPWAHVILEGRRLGTTPLNSPVRLPVGDLRLALENSAYPVIHLTMQVQDTTKRIHLRMAEHVASAEVQVVPWGEIFVDDEHVGTSPLNRAVYLLPGSHRLRISHPSLSAITRTIEARAGDTMRVVVNLNKSELAVHSSDTLTPP